MIDAETLVLVYTFSKNIQKPISDAMPWKILHGVGCDGPYSQQKQKNLNIFVYEQKCWELQHKMSKITTTAHNGVDNGMIN